MSNETTYYCEIDGCSNVATLECISINGLDERTVFCCADHREKALILLGVDKYYAGLRIKEIDADNLCPKCGSPLDLKFIQLARNYNLDHKSYSCDTTVFASGVICQSWLCKEREAHNKKVAELESLIAATHHNGLTPRALYAAVCFINELADKGLCEHVTCKTFIDKAKNQKQSVQKAEVKYGL